MKHLNKVVAAIALLSGTLLFGAAAQETGTGGARPDAPTYALRGPHMVGARDLVVEGAAPLDITVWYPAALTRGITEEAIIYSYEIKMDAPAGAVATVAGRAVRDAPYDLSAGPYPLVVLSPGFSIGRTSYAWLAEHLASHGFVVIAPEHVERFDTEMSDFWRAAVTRPQEVRSVLAYVEDQAKVGGALQGLVDPERVAVVGHSYGGYTSLIMAGARFDTASLGALCETARNEADPNAWLCDLIEPHLADLAELAGLEAVPEGLWPTWGDARVDAVISMAGDAYMFGPSGLADVTVPMMALGGTGDTGTPYLWGTQPTFEHVLSPRKASVAFENAEHMIFASTCEALPWFAEIGFYEACSDPVWDMERAHDLVSHFTTAFLLATLKEDADAAAVLEPDATSFPGVTYEVEGF